HPIRPVLLNRVDDPSRRWIPLHIRGRKDVVALVVGEEVAGGTQIEDTHTIEFDALGRRVLTQLSLIRLQRDQQGTLPVLEARPQKVQTERSLAGAGTAAREVGAMT